MKRILLFHLVLLLTVMLQVKAEKSSLKIFKQGQKDAFALVDDRHAASVLIDENAEEIIGLTAGALSGDLALITGKSAQIIKKLPDTAKQIVLAGTLGKSELLNSLVQSGKLDVSDIQNKWESFHIEVVTSPFPGVDQALVIAGSDTRGTVYGLYEISRLAGVSPWVWWADVKPEKAENLYVTGMLTSKEPSVKFRGIFLNDEDWGLQPWAAKTLEPETGDIGPKTYEKIFQLLLRLRANAIWPAMHDCTKAFYAIPGNNEMAQKYSIVVGTSHCEPMMRNNVAEWKYPHDQYNYFGYRDLVKNYWTERIQDVKDAENIVTLGMRGIHDSGMLGGTNNDEKNKMLEQVIADQRNMLSEIKQKPISEIATQIVLYKEVLDLYNDGMKIPEDVSIVWCDDNYGYITRLSNETEQKRTGGSGVYYHASYWGRPHDYLWLSTVQPGLMWYEMNKAYQNGAQNLWIINVGDIKPNEYATELFLDMAWNIESVNENTIFSHLQKWAEREFGKASSLEIAKIQDEFYRLAMLRKPEYMGWSQTEPTTNTKVSQFNRYANGNEVKRRIDAYKKLVIACDKIKKQIRPELLDSYFQLVEYPVKGAALMNYKFLYYQMAQFAVNEADKQSFLQISKQAYDDIQTLTLAYNSSVSQGKWKHFMSAAPRKLPVFSMPAYTLTPKDSLMAQKQVSNPVFIQAKDFVKATGSDNYQWKKIDGLGYSHSGITLFPFVAKKFEVNLPSVEYVFQTAKSGDYQVEIRCLPTHSNDFSQEVTVQVDDEKPMKFNINTKGRSEQWKTNVLRNYTALNYPVEIKSKGKHVLKLSVNQTGIVFDQMAVNPAGMLPYYEIIKSK